MQSPLSRQRATAARTARAADPIQRIPVTRLSSDQTCSACGGVLVPPELATSFTAPHGTDYVCLKCGRPYRWSTGHPPRLTLFVAAERRAPDEDNDD
jgi:RNase P subunit RPR2